MQPTIGFSPEALNVLEEADLILTWSDSFISRAITFFTGPLSSHALGVSRKGTSPKIIESTWPKVRKALLVDSVKGHAVAMRVLPELTERERLIILAAWESRIGERYPFWDLALQALDRKLLGGRYLLRRLSITRETVCSALLAWGYAQAGRSFGREVDEERGRNGDVQEERRDRRCRPAPGPARRRPGMSSARTGSDT